jgi:hypothetical protein
LTRQLARGRDLLDTLVGVKKRMVATDGGDHGLQAMAIETEWAAAVEKWQKATVQPMLEHLQDGAATLLPEIGTRWPPDTGKPRHARKIAWIEPWLIESLNELQQLQALVSPGAATAGRPTPTPLDDRGLMLAAVKQMHDRSSMKRAHCLSLAPSWSCQTDPWLAHIGRSSETATTRNTRCSSGTSTTSCWKALGYS